LPAEPFDAAALLTATADAKARICVRQAWYSVPASLARRRLTVKLHAEHLEVFAPGSDAIVAVHARSLHKNTETLAGVPQLWWRARHGIGGLTCRNAEIARTRVCA